MRLSLNIFYQNTENNEREKYFELKELAKRLAQYRLLAKAESIESVKNGLDRLIKQLAENISYLRTSRKSNSSRSFLFRLYSRDKMFSVKTEVEFHNRFLNKENRIKLLRYMRSNIQRARRDNRNSIHTHSIPNMSGQKQGKVWIESGIYLRAYKTKLSSQVFNEKKPKNTKNHIGVEIEFFIEEGVDSKEFAIAFAEAGLSENVTLKDDSSIKCDDNNGDTSHEVTVIDSEMKIHETIGKVCKILEYFNAKVNESCGLHIHIDARKRSPLLVLRRLLNAQKYLFKLVPHSRRNNQFCQLAPLSHSIEATSRYYAINPASYNKFKTIEVRLHSGTVNAEKIQNWIELITKIISHGVVKNSPKLESWLKAIGCCKNLTKFYSSRAKKFADSSSETEHAELPDDNEYECDNCGSHEGYCGDCERCHSCDRRA